MEFFLPMRIPNVTHQKKKIALRNGKPIVYEPYELKDARSKFLGFLEKHRPDEPLHGPVQLVTKWQYADRRKKGWKTTKPDTDNMIKLLKDCMTKEGYWIDDAQVASETIQKFYGEPEGILVRVEELS